MSVSERSSSVPMRNASGEKPGKFLIAIAFLLSIVLIGMGLVIAQSQKGGAHPSADPTPDFTLTTFDGETIRLNDLKGNIVVLNFWASWCGPCRAEASELQATWEQYRESGNVVLIGIAYADAESRSREFIDRYGLTYANGADVNLEISDQFQVQGVPMTFILDRELAVAQVIYAGVTRSQLTRIIDGILAKA